MRLVFLAIVTVVSLALAGCSDGGDQDGGSTTSSSSSTGGSSSSTTSSTDSTSAAPAANRAPTGTVSAAVNGTNATFTMNGTDLDGDELTWTLDFGDGAAANGTDLPATSQHAYTVGNYTANLTISDGEAQSSYEVAVVVAAGAAGGSQEAAGDWVAGSLINGCLSDFILGDPNYPAELDGVTYASFAIDPVTYGQPFSFDITSPAPFTDPGLTMLDADGAILYDSVAVLSDVVPAGAVTGYFWACDGAMLSGTYSAG